MGKLVIAVILAAVVAAGAFDARAGEGIEGATWRVEMVKGAGTIDTGQTSFAVSADGRVATTIGCNRMAGAARIDGDKFSIGPLMSTRMACAPALMTQEQLYGAALEAARSYSIEDGMLKLKNAAGEVIVTFAKGNQD